MEINEVIGGLGRAFDEFKQANDARLREIEKKGSADVVLSEKVDRLNAALSELDGLKSKIETLETRAARPMLGANGQEIKPETAEHRKAFTAFMRKGHEAGLADIERKALQTTVNADGGFAVPEEMERGLLTMLRDLSPMRQVANVISVSTPDYKKLVNLGGAASGWVGETAARPVTATPSLTEIAAVMGELYANLAATQTSLDDISFDAENWLLNEAAYEFSRAEGVAHLLGTGVNQPKGLLTYPTLATSDTSRAFGTIQHIAAGAAGDFGADKSAALLTAVYALKAGHRSAASWMMSKAMIAEIRAIKTTDGNYLWQPGLQAGQPSSLLGYGIVENEYMPAKAANSLSIILGDLRSAYTIVDRVGTRTLRDPYSAKPYIHLYLTKRTGSMLLNTEAVKVIKFSAT